MKKILSLTTAILITFSAFCQKKEKPICAGLFIDVPMELSQKYGYAFNGMSFGAGAWFGEQTPFTSIGIFLGITSYQSLMNKSSIIQKPTMTVIIDIHTQTRLFIAPTFSVGTEDYFDVGFKLGYAIDKQKTMYLTTFVSDNLKFGFGTIVKIK